MTFRLFVAVHLPDDAVDALEALKVELPGAAWVKRPALHLTLKFLGDGIADDRLDALESALGGVHAQAFSMALCGVGRFPLDARKPPRVLWAGVDAHDALVHLHAHIERVTDEIGFPGERGAFHPHVTLARIKAAQSGPAVTRWLGAHTNFQTGPFAVESFALVSSVLSAQGPTYTNLARFPLA